MKYYTNSKSKRYFCWSRFIGIVGFLNVCTIRLVALSLAAAIAFGNCSMLDFRNVNQEGI